MYAWSCLSCGDGNSPQAIECEQCGCPSEATANNIRSCRAHFKTMGGTIAIGAPDVEIDKSFPASRLALAAVLAVLLWYVPSCLFPETKSDEAA